MMFHLIKTSCGWRAAGTTCFWRPTGSYYLTGSLMGFQITAEHKVISPKKNSTFMTLEV